MKEIILCSAIYYNDGNKYEHQPFNIMIGYVVFGLRHHNCISINYILSGRETSEKNIQGFLTNTNKFVNRHEAYLIALNANQCEKSENLILMSEDLY